MSKARANARASPCSLHAQVTQCLRGRRTWSINHSMRFLSVVLFALVAGLVASCVGAPDLNPLRENLAQLVGSGRLSAQEATAVWEAANASISPWLVSAGILGVGIVGWLLPPPLASVLRSALLPLGMALAPGGGHASGPGSPIGPVSLGGDVVMRGRPGRGSGGGGRRTSAVSAQS